MLFPDKPCDWNIFKTGISCAQATPAFQMMIHGMIGMFALLNVHRVVIIDVRGIIPIIFHPHQSDPFSVFEGIEGSVS